MTWFVLAKGCRRQLSRTEMLSELSARRLPDDALVWTEGMAEWRPASQVFGLPALRVRVPAEVRAVPTPAIVRVRDSPLYPVVVVTLAAAAGFAALGVEEDAIAERLAGVAEAGAGAGVAMVTVAMAALALLGMAAVAAAWRHPRRRRASTGASMALLLALALAVVEAFTMSSNVLTLRDRIAAAEALDWRDDAEITLLADGEISIEGPIGPNLMRDVEAIEAAYGPLSVVEIESPGGLVSQALALAQLIEDRKAMTITRGECDSACVVIAVASANSFADAGAWFGFHGVSGVAEQTSDISIYGTEKAGAAVNAFLLAHGVPQSVIAAGAKHGANSVHPVSARQMMAYGAIRGLVEGRKVVETGPKL